MGAALYVDMVYISWILGLEATRFVRRWTFRRE